MNATLKQLRKQRFHTQDDFAMALNVSEPTVSEWETGKRTPSVEQIIKIAEVLGVSHYEVFDSLVAIKNGQH